MMAAVCDFPQVSEKPATQPGAEIRSLPTAKNNCLHHGKLDLTNAQKRDERFYPKDAVIVFNQKVLQTAPGATGKLMGIVKACVLAEVNGRCIMVSN